MKYVPDFVLVRLGMAILFGFFFILLIIVYGMSAILFSGPFY